ncbi:hypothetical protein MY11210_001566 [Beauveria gryllotalpidicola]
MLIIPLDYAASREKYLAMKINAAARDERRRVAENELAIFESDNVMVRLKDLSLLKKVAL